MSTEQPGQKGNNNKPKNAEDLTPEEVEKKLRGIPTREQLEQQEAATRAKASKKEQAGDNR